MCPIPLAERPIIAPEGKGNLPMLFHCLLWTFTIETINLSEPILQGMEGSHSRLSQTSSQWHPRYFVQDSLAWVGGGWGLRGASRDIWPLHQRDRSRYGDDRNFNTKAGRVVNKLWVSLPRKTLCISMTQYIAFNLHIPKVLTTIVCAGFLQMWGGLCRKG
jgi:hypothetical protein